VSAEHVTGQKNQKHEDMLVQIQTGQGREKAMGCRDSNPRRTPRSQILQYLTELSPKLRSSPSSVAMSNYVLAIYLTMHSVTQIRRADN
jgi:hypothetical protein